MLQYHSVQVTIQWLNINILQSIQARQPDYYTFRNFNKADWSSIIVFLNSVNFPAILTPEPNGVGEGVYGIVRVLRRRRRRDAVCVWTL